jgi:hypothetical protein
MDVPKFFVPKFFTENRLRIQCLLLKIKILAWPDPRPSGSLALCPSSPKAIYYPVDLVNPVQIHFV